MKKKKLFFIIFLSAFCIFILISYIIGFNPGIKILNNLIMYSSQIIIILPFVFILIGLFEVWANRETVEKHFGKDAGFMSYIWAIVLGGTTIGPMIVALPISYALAKKGVRLSVVFTYIGAAAVCRIPMTVFEASCLGIKFTLIRYLVSIPLIIVTSVILGNYLEKKNYTIRKGED